MGWLLRLPASRPRHTQLSGVLEAGIPDLSGVCSMNQSAAWLSLADVGFLFLHSATSVTTTFCQPRFCGSGPQTCLCPSVLDFFKSLSCSFLDGMYWICCVYWNFLNEEFFSLTFLLWKICKSDNLPPHFFYSLLPLSLDMCVCCVYVWFLFLFFFAITLESMLQISWPFSIN